jgi:endoglucanase
MTIVLSCDTSDPIPEEPDPAPQILALQFAINNSVFSTRISGNTISLTRPFPFGTSSVSVQNVLTSKGSTANLEAGATIVVDSNPTSIIVTNQKTQEKATYSIELFTKRFKGPVTEHGLLHTKGKSIVGKNNEPVSLAGNSFFWSNNNWGGEKYYTEQVVKWLALDWGTTIVRAAMGVDESGGYLQSKTANKGRVKTIVDAAIENDLYVIIDWHSHHAEDFQADAIEFFTEMATEYGSYDNVIYEIYNEPLAISWENKLKPYAEAVISAIRAKDPDNMIIVGTPEWSQRVDLAANNPITSSTNIAYTLHFYTVYHQQWLRDRATAAINAGLPIFITEWGSIGYTNTDPETDKWMEWCKANKISHCNWAVNDKVEEWSILRPGSSSLGNWSDLNLTSAGQLARNIIRGW